MQALLGAGGPIANELSKILAAHNLPHRLVGRKPSPMPGAELLAADLTDPEQAIRAVAGAQVVHLLVGLQYNFAVWRELWPRIMHNVIEACKLAQARLLFFDNVYMYGKVDGPMTEDTPVHPCSRKGELRARIADRILREVAAGNLTALIARAADFYGPSTRHGVPNVLVFEALARGARPSWLVNADVPHSFTFTPDAARGVFTLAQSEAAWNQVWHLPTAPDPPTGREFVHMAAREFGVAPKLRIYNKPMLRLAGFFDATIRESYEMLYQNDSPYLFDSSKFEKAFGVAPTPYAEGIRLTAASYMKSAA